MAAQREPELSKAARAAKEALQHVPSFQASRAVPGPGRHPGMRELKPSPPERTVYDAKSAEQLPGSVVRKEGEPPTGDPAADEAYDGLGHTHRLYAEAFGRNSIDGKGLHLDATVHYGRLYDNAFWDGQQMVFGDGDGQVFERFTKSLSVIGHELTHGVTQYSAGLVYRNQAGALNESMSDVFGALVEQHVRKQSTAEASWLIGEGLFTDQVQGTALRSMKAPGTAYDDDVLGKDPQPDSMDGYVRTERGQRRRAHQLRNPQPCVLPGCHGPRRQCLGRAGADLVRDADGRHAVPHRHVRRLRQGHCRLCQGAFRGRFQGT